MSGTRIFISYAREDIAAARRVYNTLKDAGHQPWLDEMDLLPGQKWKISIQEAIENSRFFVALLSRRSVVRKGYVQAELSRALEELDSFPDSQTYLIPARLDNCEVPRHRLRELHWVDLFPDWDAGIGKVLQTIEDSIYSESYYGFIPPGPLEALEYLMNMHDSPPYGDPTQLYKYSESLISFWQMSHFQDIADVLDGAPVGPMPNDPNAEEWAIVNDPTTYESIDGFWSSRWRTREGEWHKGTALFRVVGNWVTIEYQDERNQYVIRARSDGASRLVGRYLNCSQYFDTTAWVGVIANNTRIDGFWNNMQERWDFRR